MLQNYGLWRVFGVFCKCPTTELSVADVGREAKLTYPAVLRHLNFLQDKEIIRKRVLKKGKRQFPVYKVWLDSQEYRYYKQLYNLESVRGLVDYIQNAAWPKCIILFGSYRRGEDVEESDIDVFLLGKEIKLDLKSYEKNLHREISLHWSEDFTERPETLQTNLLNGIILRGFLDVYVDQDRTKSEASKYASSPRSKDARTS